MSKATHMRRLKKVLGTMGYTAPELDDHTEFTAACDVYSLGVALHQMVSEPRGFQELTGT